MKLPTATEMQALDKAASDIYGIPSIVLMENAGVGTVNMIEDNLGNCQNTFAPIFVGPGNNGGDGFVIGRHLHQRGCQPLFFILTNPDNIRGDSAVNLNIVRELKLPYHIIDSSVRVETIPVLFKQFETRGLPCYAIIDAIFGVGLSRDIGGHYADAINLINNSGFKGNAPIVSVDTPSGMESDSGKVLGTCVHADYTATYGCAKPGHFIHGSSNWTGKLSIIDIGIPPEAVFNANITTELVTEKVFTDLAVKLGREQSSHKGDHGHLLLLAGSIGKTGAAVLAARGALRSGVGLLTLAVPASLNTVFETSLIEAMTIPTPSGNQYLSIDDLELIEQNLEAKQAIVIGPGIGQEPETARLVLEIYHKSKCPVVLDADALNILATHRDKLQSPKGARIFTPHPGELGRLIDKSSTAIQSNRLDATVLASNLFKNVPHDAIMILKGAGTIISDNSGYTFINTTGNPGMATGGMGDVLSGVIGALICQGLSPLDAAVTGTYLHGAAADLLYAKYGVGFTASEVADAIPLTLHKQNTV